MKVSRNKRQPAPSPTPSALGRWQELHGKRRGFLERLERYAAVTIPKVCLPENVDQNSNSIQHDWQSVGAQAVNHLLNKLMLAMFSPSQPFFRLDADAKLKAQLDASGLT